MQEVKLLSERQEVLTGMAVSKRDMQKEAPKGVSREDSFEEFNELEEQRAKEALELVQKKHMVVKWEGERERARMLQRWGGSKATKRWSDARDNLSVVSRLPWHVVGEEVCSESSRKMQDKEETTSAVTKGEGREVWRLEPEGEAERPEATVPWNEAEGVPVNPEGEGRHDQVLAKVIRKERENPSTNGEKR